MLTMPRPLSPDSRPCTIGSLPKHLEPPAGEQTAARSSLRPAPRNIPSITALLICLALAGTTTVGRCEAADRKVVAETAEEIHPILTGSTLPDAKVQTTSGETTGLREFLAGKPAVVLVYRGGWCPVCTRHFADLRHVTTELDAMGLRLVALSPDSPELLRSHPVDDKPGSFTILSDHGLAASRELGLAFQVAESYMEKLAAWGLNISGNAVATEKTLPVPAVFVVDAEGTVTFSYVNPNYKVRCDPDVLLAAGRAVLRREAERKP